MQRNWLLLITVLCLIVVPIQAQDDPPPQTLTVWIPALLISDQNSEAYQQLLTHTAQFSRDNNITVEYRIKAIGTVGGIMSTIRSGSAVAPGALPDVTLIRRSDLASVQAPALLQSLENLFSSVLLNDLENVLMLGQIARDTGIQLYGLPYFVEVLHTVYNQSEEDLTSVLTFDDLLTYGESFWFPAARVNGLNQTFYLQYLAAGGVPARNGELSINQNALQTVLEFYENAVQDGIIIPQVLEYNSPSAYRTEFLNAMDQFNLGIFTSTEYLSMLQQDSSLRSASIPTSNGNVITAINGWVWVMVTTDPASQDLSIRYLNWMMEPDFHAEFARELNQVPAQQSAIASSLPGNTYQLLIDDLLNNAILPLPDTEGGTPPRAMQDALIRVIMGEATAEQATLDVVEQFTSN